MLAGHHTLRRCVDLVLALVQAVLALIVAFGFNLAPDQRGLPRPPRYGSSASQAGQWRCSASIESLQAPDASKEKADLMHAIYDRITVAGPEIVGRADAINIRIPIEGAGEAWLTGESA